ncbi:MAG: trigger factor [Planctomycetota bacterium]|nr:trigger factor [Planctomycetota bacterium]
MQNPAINTQEIRIETTPLDHFDQKLSALMPAHCITQIRERLAEGNMPQSDEQLAQLLVNICVEESMGRQSTPPLWGPALPSHPSPTLPAAGEDFEVTFLLDRMPELVLPEFSALTIRKPTRTIGEEMVEKELDSQCLEAGTHSAHEEPLETSDRFTCSVTITNPEDGSVEANFPALSGRIPAPGDPLLLDGIPFPELDQQLRGRVKGDSVSTDLVIPRQILGGSLGRSPHTVTLELVETERTVPASIEAVVERFGSPSASVLRKQIRTSLETRFEFEQAMFMTEDLFHQILESLDYTPPKRVVHALLQSQATGMAKAIREQGGSDQDVQAALERERPSAEAKAVDMLRRRAVTGVLRTRLSIGLHEQNVQDRIRQLAAIQNKRPEELRKELVDAGLITNITEQVMEQKITQVALTEATLVEVSADSLE